MSSEKTGDLADLAYELSLRTLSQQEKNPGRTTRPNRNSVGGHCFRDLVSRCASAARHRSQMARPSRTCGGGDQHPDLCIRAGPEVESQLRDRRSRGLRIFLSRRRRSARSASNARVLEWGSVGGKPDDCRLVDSLLWHCVWRARHGCAPMVAEALAKLSEWQRPRILRHLDRLPRPLESSCLKPATGGTRPQTSSGVAPIYAAPGARATTP
jgi:hypothetical protein